MTRCRSSWPRSAGGSPPPWPPGSSVAIRAAVQIFPERVIASTGCRGAVARKIGRDDGVVPRQRLDHLLPVPDGAAAGVGERHVAASDLGDVRSGPQGRRRGRRCGPGGDEPPVPGLDGDRLPPGGPLRDRPGPGRPVGEGHAGRAGRPRARLLREAFLWSERRKADKTALVRMHGNVYQAGAWLAGRMVELLFSPFDLDRIEVRLAGKPAGTAVPFAVGRHRHPKTRTPDGQARTEPAPTGDRLPRHAALGHQAGAGRTSSTTPPPAVEQHHPGLHRVHAASSVPRRGAPISAGESLSSQAGRVPVSVRPRRARCSSCGATRSSGVAAGPPVRRDGGDRGDGRGPVAGAHGVGLGARGCGHDGVAAVPGCRFPPGSRGCAAVCPGVTVQRGFPSAPVG